MEIQAILCRYGSSCLSSHPHQLERPVQNVFLFLLECGSAISVDLFSLCLCGPVSFMPSDRVLMSLCGHCCLSVSASQHIQSLGTSGYFSREEHQPRCFLWSSFTRISCSHAIQAVFVMLIICPVIYIYIYITGSMTSVLSVQMLVVRELFFWTVCLIPCESWHLCPEMSPAFILFYLNAVEYYQCQG